MRGCLRALLSLGLVTTLVIAGPEWREDEDGGKDAGSTGVSAQGTSGPGGPILGISGRLQGLAGGTLQLPTGPGPIPDDFQDVYIICIDDPDAFAATTCSTDGFSEFDARLYLFSLDGLGIVGNNDPPVVISLDATDGPCPGATLTNLATDPTGSQVIASGLYLLAITTAPFTPLGPNGEPIFFFADPDEISGPDGPGAPGPLVEWDDATGACCVAGDCLELTAADCTDQEGAYNGDDTLCADVSCPEPSNDLCENAFVIELGDTPFDTTQAMTDGGNECKGLGVLNDIWYRFTPATPGELGVNACDADFSTLVFTYEGTECPGNLATCGLECETSLIVEAGQVYQIRVGGNAIGFEGVSQGTGTLTLTLTPVGACCYDKYLCDVVTEAYCVEELYGSYQGDGTDCSECSGPKLTKPSAGPVSLIPPVRTPAAATAAPPIMPSALHAEPGGPTAAGGDTPEPDGEYRVILTGVCFANQVPIGRCDLPDGSCVESTEFDCLAGNGTWAGADTSCPLVYRLGNHPDQSSAPPACGLRIDELIDVTMHHDVFSFDFEAPGAEMYLSCDDDTIHIWGIAYGGRDRGVWYDPLMSGWVEIECTYDIGVQTAPGDDDKIVIARNGANGGTVTFLDLDLGAPLPFFDYAGDFGFTFRFGDEDDDQGHRGVPGKSGWGWLLHPDPDSPYVLSSDWLFTAELIGPDR